MESDKQAPEVSAAFYAKRLYTKALRCGIVYEEKRVKLLFVKGLDESACDNLRVYLGQHPGAPLTELARCTDTLIMIADRSVRRS